MVYQIPEYKTLDISNLILDYNGTIAVDGEIPQSMKERIKKMAGTFTIYILTADTHGTVREKCDGLPVIVETFPTGNAMEAKRDVIKRIGKGSCACLGNGRNDCLMFEEAELSIAVMDQEGVYAPLLSKADLCVRSMEEGLDILWNPARLKAGLRG